MTQRTQRKRPTCEGPKCPVNPQSHPRKIMDPRVRSLTLRAGRAASGACLRRRERPALSTRWSTSRGRSQQPARYRMTPTPDSAARACSGRAFHRSAGAHPDSVKVLEGGSVPVQSHGRRQPSQPGADDDDALHGLHPRLYQRTRSPRGWRGQINRRGGEGVRSVLMVVGDASAVPRKRCGHSRHQVWPKHGVFRFDCERKHWSNTAWLVPGGSRCCANCKARTWPLDGNGS
ncbi:hypothetical protein BHE74_00048848 [Ensete ventricosum]|nr:hypothetical protein BHE74_00048848 [Ensete ventricosum]